MSYKLERLSQPFLSPDPTNPYEAGGLFNPSLYKDPHSSSIIFTGRGVPVSGYNRGEFRPGVYMSSVMHGVITLNESLHDINIKKNKDPWITADKPYEMGMGCEDARLTRIGDIYTLPYTACGLDDEQNVVVRIGMATSKDLKNWEKHGIVGPDIPSKAATIFPQKEEGTIGMFFTVWPDSPQSAVLYREFSSLEELLYVHERKWNTFLDNYDEHIVFAPPAGARRGAEIGAPPIDTPDGLLLIHCPPNMTDEDRWDIGAALVNKDNPTEVIAELSEPLLQAETEEEINAPICRKAVFPMGAVVIQDTLLVSHGKGDTHAGLAKGNIHHLLEELRK